MTTVNLWWSVVVAAVSTAFGFIVGVFVGRNSQEWRKA